jgi:hypothetical protein
MGEPVTHENRAPSRNTVLRGVGATRFIVAALGILLALGGLDHGIFETLQGNAPTGGFFIHSIGAANQMWAYGTEDALTLIPNFLLTGIAAIAVSLLVALWSVGFAHKRHGSSIFLLLSVVLLLVGGGVAQVVLFTLAWAVSTRIGKPVTWLNSSLPARMRRPLGSLWPWLLGLFTLLSLLSLEIAISGFFPGIANPLRLLHLCWSLLIVGLVFLLAAIASAFVQDAERCRPD